MANKSVLGNMLLKFSPDYYQACFKLDNRNIHKNVNQQKQTFSNKIHSRNAMMEHQDVIDIFSINQDEGRLFSFLGVLTIVQ